MRFCFSSVRLRPVIFRQLVTGFSSSLCGLAWAATTLQLSSTDWLVMFEVILEELESWNLPADVRIVLVFACLLILFYFRYFFGAGNSPVRTTVLLC